MYKRIVYHKGVFYMSLKERYYQQIRNENLRLTKSRKAMLEILENQHLTFKEIQKALAKRGFYNVSTIYNNLEFFIEKKIVVELYINEQKYYDLSMGNPMHSADSHIHMMIKDTNEITEVNEPEIFDFIAHHDAFKDLDLEYIRITISAQKKKR
jgi:Fur family transcriptional regulator, peroxide stress response regulator